MRQRGAVGLHRIPAGHGKYVLALLPGIVARALMEASPHSAEQVLTNASESSLSAQASSVPAGGDVSPHFSPGVGVVQGAVSPGPTHPHGEKRTPKMRYAVEIKRKKGSGPKRVIRVRGPGDGPKGGRNRKFKGLNPVIKEIIDGTL